MIDEITNSVRAPAFTKRPRQTVSTRSKKKVEQKTNQLNTVFQELQNNGDEYQ